MKKLLPLLVLLYLTNPTFAQENSNWVDSILYQIVLGQIEVFDVDFKIIRNSDVQIIQIDTVISCLWTRPKYINNILQSSFDGIIVEDQIIFDTSTNKVNSNFINFRTRQYDENGNYLNDKTEFLISKVKLKSNKQKTELSFLEDLKNTIWTNQEIEVDGKKIELDSCHQIFKLRLNSGFTFQQYYGYNDSSCKTVFMDEKKEIGVEGDLEKFLKYRDKLQGHYLTVQEGDWRIENNELRLIDRPTKKVILFEIDHINKKELYLKSKDSNYQIKMRKLRL